MKLYISVFILLLVHHSFDEPKIIWNDYPVLDFYNFNGEVDKKSIYSATSYIGFYYGLDNKVAYAIGYFDCNKSWIKTKDSLLLLHEQGHFDLSEVCARQWRKELGEHFFNSSQLKIELDSLCNNFLVKWDSIDNIYEQETDYSKNKEKQLKWNKKINEWLIELDEYKEPYVNVNFNDK
jgi:hypothetical protein